MQPKINWHPRSRDIRKFGMVILIGFAVIGGILVWKGRLQAAHMVWAASAFVGFLSIAFPSAGKPFYWIWMGAAFVLGSVMSRVLLVAIYFGVLTPLAVGMRLSGRDALRRKRLPPDTPTHWTPHPDIDRKNYEHLF